MKAAVLVGVLLLCGLLVLVELLLPLVAYRQGVAGVLRSEWVALPPVPGSRVSSTDVRTWLMTSDADLRVEYASSGACAEVQAYYATTALAAGWEVHRPLRSIHHTDPPEETLETTYHKHAQVYSLSLTVECVAGASGYVVALASPPTDG